jgi:superfamily II DNA or RNA helicase
MDSSPSTSKVIGTEGARVSSLTSFAGYFGRASRDRGEAYFAGGRVSIKTLYEASVAATVRGSALYRVQMQRDARRILTSCTCPAFAGGDFCKHLWAVLVALDDQGVLKDLHAGGPVDLVHESRSVDDLESEDGQIDDPDEPAFTQPVPSRFVQRSQQGQKKPRPGGWRTHLAELGGTEPPEFGQGPWPAGRGLLYVIDVAGTLGRQSLYLEICSRDPKRDGSWGKPKARPLPRALLNQLPDLRDRRILALLAGATVSYVNPAYGGVDDVGYEYGTLEPRYRLVAPQAELLVPMLCDTGRCRVRVRPNDEEPLWRTLTWDDGEPWDFRIEVRMSRDKKNYEVLGALWRGAERMDLGASVGLIGAGVFMTADRAARYEHHDAGNWIELLRERGLITVPLREGDAFVEQLLRQPRLPPIELPPELRYERITVAPQPRLTIKTDTAMDESGKVTGELAFDYGGSLIAHGERGQTVLRKDDRRVLVRDLVAENAAVHRLEEFGFRRNTLRYGDHIRFTLSAVRLADTVRDLLAEGWRVDAEGKTYRRASRFDLHVRSGIDWFELHGALHFDGQVAQLPDLLAAARKGTNLVRLGDGTFGVLPEDWLRRYGALASTGDAHADHMRFERSQVGLLDALLAEQPDAHSDAPFEQLRAELQNFSGIQREPPPAGFIGELRPYQLDGLGWFAFLRRVRFGGCLADDMGLGKTVQVLALLESRRELREHNVGEANRSAPGPSLVVMPKSLIFNWKQEAARFAPRLKILDHTGTQRRKGARHFAEWDVILTTYGTLRRDAADFRNARFDYVILDEAQAVKNAASDSAKAVRLLRGEHRLALSGTPIENHLGELWTLFDFLNPGMLGTAAVFKSIHAATNDPDTKTREALARALRPFLLRRTKEQVAPELPAKLEQTLYCELESKQRKLYDELRDHYRDALSKRVERDGIGRSKIHILQALLHLRQAAIHPALIDARRAAEPSAKLDMLMPQLTEVIDEGHKVLVFSQFTQVLALVRSRLDELHLTYEYLDGKTRDREARVARFQNDPDCKLFLISLKAGGVGLNLTAAQYVYLLDPWWNPAVEAQAIDRAHRIGQKRSVFAYRLIARDTVEEKILELQATKRDLADAIINADNALIRSLGKEDLELLLS